MKMAQLNESKLKLSDVQRALGYFPGTVSKVCTYKGINKWARYKPVRSSQVDVPSRAHYEQMASAVTVCWGFDRTSFISGTSIGDLANAAAANGADWKYNVPNNPPYRLSDFAGYDHYAQPPCNILLPSGTVLTGTRVSLSLNASAKAGGLGLIDFKAAFGGDNAWNSLRWAVARIEDRLTVMQRITMDLGPYVKDNSTYSWNYTLVTGTYELLVFLTNAPSADAVGGAYYYIMLPGGYASLKVVTAMIQFSVSNLKFENSPSTGFVTSVSLDFMVTNNRAESIQVGLILLVKRKTNAIITNPNPNETIYVSAGATERRTIKVTTNIAVMNDYEGCCGYRDEAGDYHWYTLSGTAVDSMGEAWTDLGLIPTA